MDSLYKYSKEQYQLVRESRKVLLNYCETIRPSDFLMENSLFGRGGSIRNLLVHTANTYEFWIAKCALNKNIVFTSYEATETIGDVIDLFHLIDALMFEFIESFQNPGMRKVSYEINGIKNNADAFKIFSHVITHEFHHKGQVLSLSRHLGYIPVDTDIMR